MKSTKIVMAIGILLAAGAILANLPIASAQAQTVRIDMKASRYQFTPSTIRVKAGTPVELHVVSTDVVHGFAIQALKINERLNPGKEVVIRFTPTKAGRYPFICSVFCGPQHSDMKGELVVE
jgi:cytochrome c oxidase subunit 2